MFRQKLLDYREHQLSGLFKADTFAGKGLEMEDCGFYCGNKWSRARIGRIVRKESIEEALQLRTNCRANGNYNESAKQLWRMKAPEREQLGDAFDGNLE